MWGLGFKASGGRSSERYLDPWFLGVGPSRNLGVLPSNNLRGREERKKRGRSLGRAAATEPREQAVPAASMATKI